MLHLIASVALLLSSTVIAKTCTNLTVPVTISSRNGVFNIEPPLTNLASTAFIQMVTQQGRNFSQTALKGYTTVSGTYNISAMFCVPGIQDKRSSTLQILTHGLGLDKSYWDLPYNNYNYSYIDTALSSGFSTFSYDRLGIGNSSHASSAGATINEIQIFLEIAALVEITRMLRNGTFSGISESFKNIIHVGHSFGSIQAYGLVATYPEISDGIILTGFSLNPNYIGFFSAGGNFQQAYINQKRLGAPPLNYVPGYLVNADTGSLQYLNFYPGYFDVGILRFGEQNKQPFTAGELLTLGSGPKMNKFKGPVMVITGSNDLPFCGGNCFASTQGLSSIPADVKAAFPNAKKFEAYIQPNTGHALNFHYNATAGYEVIQNFLKAQDL